MLSDTIGTFKMQLESGTPLMALDIGERKIGVAVSDANRIIAFPDQTLIRKNKKQIMHDIQQLIAKKNISGLVIGYPLSLDGTKGEACAKIDLFIKQLTSYITIPLYLQDERFTTHLAQQTLKEQQLNRKKREQKDDAVAASYLLDTVLKQL